MVLPVSQQPDVFDRSQTIFTYEGKFCCQSCWRVVDQGTASLSGAVFSGGCCVLFVPPYNLFMLIATVTLGLFALPPSLRSSSVDSSVYHAILFGGLVLLVLSPFYTSRAPSVFTTGPSQSFLQRTLDMPLKSLGMMEHVVPCLLTLSSDTRISVRFSSFFFLLFLLPSFPSFFFSSFLLSSSRTSTGTPLSRLGKSLELHVP